MFSIHEIYNTLELFVYMSFNLASGIYYILDSWVLYTNGN